MHVVLIGYRGSGKSSVAVTLSGRLGWSAVDADVEIERRAGKSIRAIFADEGEPRFRQLERDVMVDLLGHDDIVIAAGGGAVEDDSTRRRLSEQNSANPVVWLRASVETIERRLSGDATTADRRPNLTASGGRQEIEQLLVRREPLYREAASLVIDTDGLTVEQIAERILAALPRSQGNR